LVSDFSLEFHPFFIILQAPLIFYISFYPEGERMQIISVPALCMAVVTFYVGFYHLLLFFRRGHSEDLSFSVMCFLMGCYDILCVGQYNTHTVADGFAWQRGQVAVLSLIGAAYGWFAADYVRFPSKKIRNIFAAFFIVSAVLVYFIKSPLFWHPESHAVKHLRIISGFDITYYEVAPGFFPEFLSVMGLFVYCYVFYLSYWMVRKDKPKSKALFFSALIFGAGLINDALVHSLVIPNVYVIEYATMAVVLLMANNLSKTIVESAQLKEAFEASESRYRSLIDNSLVGLFISRNGVIRFCNKPFAALFGYTKTEYVLGKPDRDFLPPEWTGNGGMCSPCGGGLPKDGFARCEYRVKTVFGKEFDLELLMTPLFFEGVQALQGSVIDITARKNAEKEIQRSLDEKNVLLKEINHRVKNNLQIIISLLNLESGRSGNKQVHEVLQNCNQRILTMAVVHEMLYRSDRFEWIDFHEYAIRLVTDLIDSFDVEGRIRPRLEVQNAFLALDQAIPCGLILNELITNSIKHAFPDGKEGAITIRFLQHGDGFFELNIADDGIGIPTDAGPGGTNFLGLRLVDVLVEQLGGTIEKKSGKGVSFSIVFPVMRLKLITGR
jgi:PAS domain S-box-containing protein